MAVEKTPMPPVITGAGGAKNFPAIEAKTSYVLYTPASNVVLRITIVSEAFSDGMWNVSYTDAHGTVKDVAMGDIGATSLSSKSFVIRSAANKPVNLEVVPEAGKKMNVYVAVETMPVATDYVAPVSK